MINEQTKARIAQEAEERYPYVWPKNKHGEEIVMRVGQKAPPFSAKIRKLRHAYIAGAEAEATRSQALYDCLKLIREMPEGVWFAKTIDKALEKYDNSK